MSFFTTPLVYNHVFARSLTICVQITISSLLYQLTTNYSKRQDHSSQLKQSHLTWLRNAQTQIWENRLIGILKGSPWTGLPHPGRNRWWRRSRPPKKRPIPYTGEQNHNDIKAMETRLMQKNEIWLFLKKMAVWINVLLRKMKSVDNALPHALISYMHMHLYTHHFLYTQNTQIHLHARPHCL